MNIDIDSIIEIVLDFVDYLAEFTVTIGGVSIGLIDFFLVFIVVDVIILFIKAFTSKGGGNSD